MMVTTLTPENPSPAAPLGAGEAPGEGKSANSRIYHRYSGDKSSN